MKRRRHRGGGGRREEEKEKDDGRGRGKAEGRGGRGRCQPTDLAKTTAQENERAGVITTLFYPNLPKKGNIHVACTYIHTCGWQNASRSMIDSFPATISLVEEHSIQGGGWKKRTTAAKLSHGFAFTRAADGTYSVSNECTSRAINLGVAQAQGVQPSFPPSLSNFHSVAQHLSRFSLTPKWALSLKPVPAYLGLRRARHAPRVTGEE